jgi:hypothetical protein
MSVAILALIASLNLASEPALAQSVAINPYVAFDVQYYGR